MKILVIGLGSMGKRRIRLLKQTFSSEAVITGVDNDSKRLSSVMAEMCIEGVVSLKEALVEEYDCAFVCTSPLSHANIIKHLLRYNLYIFTELNLVQDGYETFVKNENQSKIFLSSTFLYRKEIEYIQKKTLNNQVNYIYHSGQYLPDWHPWESYKKFFVQDKRTNACREIMAIDFPWIIYVFGKVKKIYAFSGKDSSLEIDYNDTYQILIEHENGTRGYIAIDIISRVATRKLEIFSESIHLYWEGKPDSLYDYNITSGKLNLIPVYENISREKNYCENIIENAYMDEILAFMDIVKNQDYTNVKYSFKNDRYILDLIDRIERM